MMEILFRRPELDDRETILKHLSERRLRGCERTFANVYLWARFYNEGWRRSKEQQFSGQALKVPILIRIRSEPGTVRRL